MPALRDRLLILLLGIVPQHGLSAVMHRLARSEWPPLKRWLIRRVCAAYRVDLSSAAEPDPLAYRSFNAFFTRALRSDARPLDPDPSALLSPVDGRISQFGSISHGNLLQAKGHHYRLEDLLAGDSALTARLDGGQFATIYLSPPDYHRIHMPWPGRLQSMTFVPGRLFSVNAASVAGVPRLFARNERLILTFECSLGPLVVIFVGAIFVGSMETVWAGEVRGPRHGPSQVVYAGADALELARGAEIGRFNMGSTVIVLTPPGAGLAWRPDLAAGTPLRMGERLGNISGADRPA